MLVNIVSRQLVDPSVFCHYVHTAIKNPQPDQPSRVQMKGLFNYSVDAQSWSMDLQGGKVLESQSFYTVVKQTLSLSAVNLSQLAWTWCRWSNCSIDILIVLLQYFG